MTMPDERARALRFAGGVLREMNRPGAVHLGGSIHPIAYASDRLIGDQHMKSMSSRREPLAAGLGASA